jgi:hypothetical protein
MPVPLKKKKRKENIFFSFFKRYDHSAFLLKRKLHLKWHFLAEGPITSSG